MNRQRPSGNALVPTVTVDRPDDRLPHAGRHTRRRSSSAGPASAAGVASAVVRGDQATIMTYVLFHLRPVLLFAKSHRRHHLCKAGPPRPAGETETVPQQTSNRPAPSCAIPPSASGCAAGESLAKTLMSNPTTAIGFILIFLLLAMAIFAPWLATPNVPDPYQMPRDWGAMRMPPGTPGYPLGTTNQGGDVLYGVIWGSRTSLQLSIIVVSVTVVIGVSSSAPSPGSWAAGSYEALMRVVDIFLSIPERDPSRWPWPRSSGHPFTNIILSLCLVFWVKYARDHARADSSLIRQADYVQAARVIGDRAGSNIFRRDIRPNASTPIAVQATLDMGNIVLVGATLSFIGLAAVWHRRMGRAVSEGQSGIASGRWWASTFPGLMIFLWALAFNLVGDGLRDCARPEDGGQAMSTPPPRPFPMPPPPRRAQHPPPHIFFSGWKYPRGPGAEPPADRAARRETTLLEKREPPHDRHGPDRRPRDRRGVEGLEVHFGSKRGARVHAVDGVSFQIPRRRDAWPRRRDRASGQVRGRAAAFLDLIPQPAGHRRRWPRALPSPRRARPARPARARAARLAGGTGHENSGPAGSCPRGEDSARSGGAAGDRVIFQDAPSRPLRRPR